MSRFTFNRKRLKLKKLLGIRARLAVLALILVAPLMLDRARSLEDTRAKEITQATQKFHDIAQHSVEAQREIIASVETMMKSAAYISASAGGVDRSCDILRTSLKIELPWIRSMSIVARDGRVQCSTLPRLVGMNIGDRSYFKKALETRGFVFSDYLFARVSKIPTMMGAYPVSAIAAGEEAVIVAGINLDWMSKIVGDLDGRPGISAVLIRSTICRCLRPSPTRRSVRTRRRNPLRPPRTVQSTPSASRLFPAPVRAWSSALMRQRLRRAPIAKFAPPICNWDWSVFSCC